MSAEQGLAAGPGQPADVGAYAVELMRLLLHVSPGPIAIRTSRPGRHEVTTEAGTPIAKFTRAPDAALFVRALADLRAQTAAVVDVLAQHRDNGAGCCEQDGQQVPCTTRQLIIAQLGPRVRALEASGGADGRDQRLGLLPRQGSRAAGRPRLGPAVEPPRRVGGT